MSNRRPGWRAAVLALAVGPPARAEPPTNPGLTEVHSQDGTLAVTLVAAPGTLHIGSLTLAGATYNGAYAGPVLHAYPGDRLRVRLVNHLAEPTNLHFHGLFTSPLGNGDNVHLTVPPGASFTYDVRVPADQPPGVYWYHPHLHGTSERQVMSGLSGALLIDPPNPPVGPPVGPPSGPPQRLFVLKDISFDDPMGDPAIDDTLLDLVQSINGGLAIHPTMVPGGQELWRFSNQSADRPVHLALQDHRFRIVARDGEPVKDPPVVTTLDIMPAGRVDVLVEAGRAGRYPLRALGVGTGSGAAYRPDRALGELTVAGAPAPTPAPAAPEPLPRDLRSVAVGAHRTMVFSETTGFDPARQRFFVNGRTFDPDRIDLRVPLGAVEEWTVRNDSDDLHVFHIHQIGFQVVAVNGVPVPFNGRIDTVRVPERGSVTLRLAFTHPEIVGRFVFHCHVLQHEDRGMMAQIEVYDPRPAGLTRRLGWFWTRLWWWWHGVPWSQCGLG
jgi:FtsP/CotA-like multicopper oxidase with cupredoxin domain